MNSLVSLTELKVYIAINEDNTSFDASLVQLAKVATKSLENYCRRSFSVAEYVEYFGTRDSGTFAYDLYSGYENIDGILEGAETQKFPLKGFPVSADLPFEVRYDLTRQFSDVSVLAATDYYLSSAGNTLFLLRATAQSPRSLKVTYTAGYDTEVLGGVTIISGAPENLKLACIMQVVFMFNKLQEANIGVKGSKKHSPEYIQNDQMLCPEAQALAVEFRRNLVGRR